MIISDTHRFVFAHVPKTGGISVRAALEPFADGQSAVLRGTTHETLPELLAREPRLASHFKFAFVRNPWDRLVSFYVYARAKLKPTVPEMQNVSFGRMLRLLNENTPWLERLHAMRPQSEYVRGADFVGRFERLAADFAHICERLGLSVKLPHKNTSRHADYAAYYDAWGRDLVSRRYAQDIQQFGYAFEASP